MQDKVLEEDTPHSELRLRIELNQKTSNSGHSIFFHIIESTIMVKPVLRRISHKVILDSADINNSR